MKYTAYPKGVCCKEIAFEMEEGNVLHNVQFVGGCHGNLQGIGRLVEGMKAEEVIQRVQGICCGSKTTSCPDQLARILQETIQ